MEKLEKEFLENGGEWRKVCLDEYFTNENGDTDIQNKHINNRGEVVVSSGIYERGIIGRTDLEAKIIDENCITCLLYTSPSPRDRG